MAQKFGGRYSNQKPAPGQTWQDPEAIYSAANPVIRPPLILYLASAPLLIAGIVELIAGDIVGMVGELAAFAILLTSAGILSQGMRAQRAFEERNIARPPAFPRKIFAAALSGLGVSLAAAVGWGMALPLAGILGATTCLAHLTAFGLDPMRSKGLKGQDGYQAERVAKAIEKAESILDEILVSSHGFEDRDLELHVAKMCNSARAMFRTVEEDPRDLSRARKFLTVYLQGARDATNEFAGLFHRTHNSDARIKYMALLNDLENTFESHREMLLEDDQ
ncbi:MAG TPA: 5-bromo-4-chloroindolyl phosphate hydrolysis family protein, partial [Paracoccaceae bacterium]|nr:5-bromo-4-chloroindolyl phosphate hydrolysis family protein [Paracoccaceae bacterium]